MNRKIFTILFLIGISIANCVYADFPQADLNQDGKVNSSDLCSMIDLWLADCYQAPCWNIDIKDNGLIDYSDFAGLANYWKTSDSNQYQVGYWPMDESIGFIVNDATSNDHNATMSGMTVSDHITGKRGKALDFDGSNDLVVIDTLDNGLGQHFKRDFSISAWVYVTSPTATRQTIIGIESTSEFQSYGFEGFTLELSSGVPVVFIAFSDNQMGVFGTATTLTTNQWHHLCVVREGSYLKFYIDGKMDSVQRIPDTNIRFGSDWPGYDSIGATYDSYFDHNEHFRGKLDEIHLYNFAISESLISKLSQNDYASMPVPDNGRANVLTDSNLVWQKGAWTGNYHDVYLGTDSSQVNAADTNTAGIYRGRQTSRLFNPPALDANKYYYWRIDDVNAEQIHKGSVWSFKTVDLNSDFDASTYRPLYGPRGAADGNRFTASIGQSWKGASGQSSWSWQQNFATPRQIGSILMIMGEPETSGSELEFYQINAPLSYKWQYSLDGVTWTDLPETAVQNEKRTFRIQRLNSAVSAKHIRLEVKGFTGFYGLYPVIREIEFYSTTDANVPFGNWIVPIDITNEPTEPYGNTSWFVRGARRCSGWGNVQAQQLWVADFNDAFLNIEPYPTCVFISGSFDEWCQVTRKYFTGLQEVVVNGRIPMWGSCGGAQVLGLLIDPGSENPWDCPRCRYYHNPAWSPIYGHIGYLDPGIEPQACGNYDNCQYEIGDYKISQVVSDPVFNGLPNPFYGYEYHCGQLNYLPPGWHRIGGQGSGTLTYYQCFRRTDRYIYGAQFHIENDSESSQTNAHSTIIMGNFLNLAQGWGGYHRP